MRTRSILIATAVAVVLGLSVPLAFKAGVGIAVESRASSLENASPIPTSGENLAVELARRLNVAFDKNGRDNLLERIGRFFGVVPRFFGKILSPLEAKHHATEGSIEWTSLSKSADKSFYQNFDHVRFARQGEPLVIESTVRLVATDDLTLGEADGNSADVGSSSSKFGLTPYWTYLGSRYDRAWVRVLNFPEDTIVRIKPVGPPEESLITTEVRPTIGSDGVLTYTMKAGQTLRFIDGRAGFDWFRLRSYQDVDYIVFEHAAHNSRPQGHF